MKKEDKSDSKDIFVIHEMRNFKIDWEKIKTIDQIVLILEGLDLHIRFDANDCPEWLKELYDLGLLIEKK